MDRISLFWLWIRITAVFDLALQKLNDDDACALHPTCSWYPGWFPFYVHSNSINLSQVSLHYLLSITHEEYGKATSVSHLTNYINGPQPPYKDGVPEQYYKPSEPIQLPERKANATFVMLVRNSDGPNIMNSMKQIEDRFNRKFQYPYVFLNDKPFTDNFKKFVTHGAICYAH